MSHYIFLLIELRGGKNYKGKEAMGVFRFTPLTSNYYKTNTTSALHRKYKLEWSLREL